MGWLKDLHTWVDGPTDRTDSGATSRRGQVLKHRFIANPRCRRAASCPQASRLLSGPAAAAASAERKQAGARLQGRQGQAAHQMRGYRHPPRAQHPLPDTDSLGGGGKRPHGKQPQAEGRRLTRVLGPGSQITETQMPRPPCHSGVPVGVGQRDKEADT